MKKYISYLVIVILLNSCNAINFSGGRTPDRVTPVALHSLLPAKEEAAQVIWEQHVYVESSADKRVKCASINDVVVLSGSQNAQSDVKVFALDGETGSLLWSFDKSGILASSDTDLFIANGTTVYSVDPVSGNVKWEKNLSGSRNITGMMYYDGFLYLNTTGIYPYYTLNTDGQIASRYTDVSGFRTSQIDIPFYPDMPFGVYTDDATFILHSGNALYSGEVYDKSSKQLLWEIKQDSISNFISHLGSIMWISSDDQIKIADEQSGKLDETINIVPGMDFFAPNVDKQHAGYYLCGNNKSNNIYVILGDSQQIFALRLK